MARVRDGAYLPPEDLMAMAWLGAGLSIEGKILTKVVGIDPETLRDALLADLVAAGGSPEFPREHVGISPINRKQFSRECNQFGVTEAEVTECVKSHGHFYFHCFGKHPSSVIGLRRAENFRMPGGGR